MSTQRLNKAFVAKEPEDYVERSQPKVFMEGETLVRIKNGHFGWSDDGDACLEKIDVTIRNGQLVGIVGQAGSGTSVSVTNALEK